MIYTQNPYASKVYNEKNAPTSMKRDKNAKLQP